MSYYYYVSQFSDVTSISSDYTSSVIDSLQSVRAIDLLLVPHH